MKETKAIPFERMFDIPRLKQLFDSFFDAVGISTAIASREAEIIIESGWQRICADFHRQHPETGKTCIQNNRRLHEHLLSTGEHIFSECPHGMIDAVAPIVVEGRPVAFLHASQFRLTPLDKPTMAAFRSRARQWGFDEIDYVAALQEVPVLSRKRAAFILEYLRTFTETIGELGASQQRQEETAKRLARLYDSLEKEVAGRREETRRLNQLLDGSPIPTFVIDAAHRVTHWNFACERLTGIAADAIVGTDRHRQVFYRSPRSTLVDLVADDAKSHDLAMLYDRKVRSSRLLAGGYEGKDFFPHLGPGGRWLYFCAAPIRDERGGIVGAIETIQDVTDLHLAEAEVRASDTRYRQIFESVNDGLFVLRDGHVVDCNPKALSLFEASRPQMIGKMPIDFSPAFQPDGSASIKLLQARDAAAMKGSQQVFEWRFQRNDGSDFDAEVSLTRSMIAGDAHLLAIVRDVSERKRMMAALRENETELNRRRVYLEKVNEALKTSLDHREVEKRAIEESILTNLKRFVFPYLESLGDCDLGSEARASLNIIETNLNEVISQFSTTIFSKYIDFTPTEVKIADFIREGKDTKAVARLLGLSPSSIQWHRKNIREKLGLKNQKINLHTYLNSLSR